MVNPWIHRLHLWTGGRHQGGYLHAASEPVTEFGGPQKLLYRSSQSNRYIDEGTQTDQEVDLHDQDNDQHSSVRSVTSARSFHQTVHEAAPVYQFDSFPYWKE